MDRQRRLASILVAALCIALLACAKRHAARPPEAAVAPAFEGPVTVENLRKAVFFEGFNSLRSEVNVKVLKDGKTKGSFKGAFLYRPPGAIRLRAYDPFGDAVMDLVKSGSVMQVYLPMEDTLYEGWTPPIGIPPDALFSLEEGKEHHTLYVLRPGRLAGEPLELYGKFIFDRRSLRNSSMAIYSGGSRFMELSINAFSGGVPAEMELAFFNGFSISLDLVEPEAGAELPGEAFAPISHDGRSVQPLKALINNLSRNAGHR